MNEQRNNKITFFQGLLIFIVVIYPISIRYIISNVTEAARQAGWLSCICSLILFVPFLYALYTVARKFEGQSLHDILCRVFGKPIGVFVSFLYLFWIIMLLGYLIKFSGEKIVTSAFVGSDINLMMFLLVATVAIMLKWGITVIARMNKLIYVLIMVQFLLVLLFVSMNFKMRYVTPVSTLDIVPILNGAIYPLSVFAYITPLFIFNDKIIYAKRNVGKLAFTAGFISLTNALALFVIVGTYSHYVVAKQKFPFLSAVENISVFNSSAGLDSLFASIWILSEFVVIAYFSYCTVRLIKNIFNLKNDIPALTAVLGFSFFFAVYYCKDVFELIELSKNIMSIVDIIMGIGIPVVLFVTAKIRKMI